MSFTFVIKETGEEITLPSHTGEPAEIDPLPKEVNITLGETELVFMEFDDFLKLYNEYKSLPWYKRFCFRVKQFWYRYI